MRRIYQLITALSFCAVLCAPVGSVHGQCNAFGDPIVNITFGRQGDPINPLPIEIIPGYVFDHSDAGLPGRYTIVSRGTDAGSIYHDFANHTEGDPNGRMLIVNANEQPGIFYTEIQSNLCPNTSFSFSAAIMNASPPDLACARNNNGRVEPINVLFEIQTLSGDVIASHRTGEIYSTNTPQWREVNLTFDTQAHTEVRLVMQNIGPGGCGNNIAIDDIQFRPCGPETRLLPQDIAIEQDTVFTCVASRHVTFNSLIGPGYLTEVYQWQQRTGENGTWQDMSGQTGSTLTVEPAHDTWYRLTVASTIESMNNPQCRITSAPFRAAHAALPVLSITEEERRTCVGNALALEPRGYAGPDVGTLRYQWYSHGGDGNWQAVAGADAVHYTPDVSVPGTVYYQRRGINICGHEFPTNEFRYVVEAWVPTSFVLPVTSVCLSDAPMLLTGGTPAVFGNDPGVYSGIGVSNGYFDPAVAGIGVHDITYTPAASVLCPVPSTVQIRVSLPVEAEAMDDQYVVAGRSVRLHVRDNNGVSYLWDNALTLDRPDVPDPRATPSVSTTYTVTIANAGGCTTTASVQVHVLDNLVIPNAFSPNGDSFNDVWAIQGLEHYPDMSIKVFNRWGTAVYTATAYDEPWDGQFNASALPAATYYYIIDSSVLGKPFTGAVTILR